MMRLCITIIVAFTMAFANVSTDKKEVKRGKEMRVSGLKMKANNTLGSGMFEMGRDGDDDSNISFGFAKIVELAADDTVLTDAKHGCKFDTDDAGIECTESEETEGTMSGLDDEATAKEIKHSMIKRECALSSCNTNQNAKIVISTYIFKESGYLCQPDCEAESIEQSPVFNGTAKWTIEIKDWDFCTGCGDSSDKDAAKLKIFFSLSGKSKGRPSAPAKRGKKTFDVTKCKQRVEKEKAEKAERAEKDKGKAQGGKRPDNENENKPDDVDEDKPDDVDEDKPDDVDEDKPQRRMIMKGTATQKREIDIQQRSQSEDGTTDENRGTRGRCKTAKDTSFDGQPEDQESFNFSDEEGKSARMVFRMFPSAILDKDHDSKKIVNTESGFVGPAVEVVKEPVGNSGKTRDVKYVTICVDKFSKSVLYDPTGDMSESGGTTTPSSTATLRATLAVVLASLAVLLY